MGCKEENFLSVLKLSYRSRRAGVLTRNAIEPNETHSCRSTKMDTEVIKNPGGKTEEKRKRLEGKEGEKPSSN